MKKNPPRIPLKPDTGAELNYFLAADTLASATIMGPGWVDRLCDISAWRRVESGFGVRLHVDSKV